MSKPNDFDRLDNAPGHPPDRFQRFKQDMQALTEYREAYHRAKQADPASVAGLPDPDSPIGFDAAAALARLQGAAGALRAVPPTGIRA